MRISRAIILGMLGCMSATGCASGPTPHIPQPAAPVVSQVPVPAAFPLSTQQTIQAAHHWEIIAKDIACRTKDAMDASPLLRNKNVFVAPSGITPFAKTFREMLITKLMETGVGVTNNNNSRLMLTIDLNMLSHGKRMKNSEAGVYKGLAPSMEVGTGAPLAGPGAQGAAAEQYVKSGEVNVEAGKYTFDLPEHELVVNASLLDEDTYIMRHTAEYYIDDEEAWHYKDEARPSKASNPAVVNVRITDR